MRWGRRAPPTNEASPDLIDRKLGVRASLVLADVAVEVLAVDEAQDLDPAARLASIEQSNVGADLDAVEPICALHRLRVQARMREVLREQHDLLERGLQDAVVPLLDRFVELRSELGHLKGR